jgi:hypothetical protein
VPALFPLTIDPAFLNLRHHTGHYWVFKLFIVEYADYLTVMEYGLTSMIGRLSRSWIIWSCWPMSFRALLGM